MSIRLITQAFDTRVGDHIAKAVLIKLADNANDQGIAWPRVSAIAHDTEIPERTVKRKLAWLVAEGFIEIKRERREGRFGGNTYLILPGATVAHGNGKTGGHGGTAPGATGSSAPFVRQEEPSKTAAEPRARNPIWDALTELFGSADTETSATLRGKIVRSLKNAGADADEVRARAARWPKVMPPETLMTETALEKHWPLLAPPKRKSGGRTCSECGISEGAGHAADCSRARVKA